MAFAKTMVKKVTLGNGQMREIGTWLADGGTASGTITADTDSPAIMVVETQSFASNGDTAVLPAKDVALNAVKITFTANDGGDYTLEGPAA